MSHLIKSNCSLGCTVAADVPTYLFQMASLALSDCKDLMSRVPTLSLMLQLLHVVVQKPVRETMISPASGPSENTDGSPISSRLLALRT